MGPNAAIATAVVAPSVYRAACGGSRAQQDRRSPLKYLLELLLVVVQPQRCLSSLTSAPPASSPGGDGRRRAPNIWRGADGCRREPSRSSPFMLRVSLASAGFSLIERRGDLVGTRASVCVP